MLEKQQHILPLDDLFEDELIGAFVRSIQIDSPYQQLIFKGVLTETIKEERVMVTFTVEGYFHYVLGEVIYNQAKGKKPKILKNIIENNQLKGAIEGVEQCLVKDVEKEDLCTLLWLIDNLADSSPCLHGLMHAMQVIEVEFLTKELLKEESDNDFKLLYQAILSLGNMNKFNCLLEWSDNYHLLWRPKNTHSLRVISSLIAYCRDFSTKQKITEFVENNVSFSIPTNKIELDIASRLLEFYQVHFWTEEGISWAKRCLKYELKKYGENHPYVSNSYNELGLLATQKKDYKTGLKYFNQSLEILNNIERYNEIEYSITSRYHNIALSNNYLGRFTEARKYYEITLIRRRDFEGKYTVDYAQSLSNLGIVLFNQAKIDCFFEKERNEEKLDILSEAIKMIREAFVINTSLFGEINGRNVHLFPHLALALVMQGDVLGAESLLRKSIIVAEEVFGLDSKFVWYRLTDLTTFLVEQEKYKEVLPVAKKAIKLAEPYVKSERSSFINSYWSLAGIYFQLGRHEKAIESYKKIEEIRINSKIDGPKFYYNLHHDLAHLYFKTENWSLAKRYFTKCWKLNRTASNAFNLAKSLEKLSLVSDSLDYFLLAAKKFKASEGIKHPNTKSAVKNLLRIKSHFALVKKMPKWIESKQN